jgi:hypothetical protein
MRVQILAPGILPELFFYENLPLIKLKWRKLEYHYKL